MYAPLPINDPPEADWLAQPPEGRLALDMFRDNNALVIRTPVAGVEVPDLDIAIDGDLLTIRELDTKSCPATMKTGSIESAIGVRSAVL